MRDLPQTPEPHDGVLLTLSAAEEANLDDRGIPRQLGRQFRRVTKASYDKDTHTVTMAVSSETPVDRYYGTEILSHKPGAVRMDRLKQGIALLFNHDMDQHLGRSQSYDLSGGVLHITNRFGTNPLALEKEGDVDSGILTDVSIGYVVYAWDVVEDKNGQRTYTATDWELLENSLVTVPADPTVGVGRSLALDALQPTFNLRKLSEEPVPGTPAEAERTLTAAGNAGQATTETKPGSDPVRSSDDDEDEDEEDPDDETAEGSGSEAERTALPSTTEPTPAQRNGATMALEATTGTDLAAQNAERIKGLRALRTQYKDHYSEDTLLNDIANGERSVDQARTTIADAIIAGSQRTQVATLGDDAIGNMSDKEKRSYSLRNALRYAINQRFPGTFSKADGGFELEVSDTLRKDAERSGITGLGSGILMPNNLPFNQGRAVQQAQAFGTPQQQARLMTAGGAVGGATIFTTTESTPIEILRAKARCLQMGATVLSGLSGLLRIPKQNVASQSNWLAEQAAGSYTDIGFTDISFSPKRLNLQGQYTMELLSQTAVAIEDLLRADQTAVKALSLDYVGLAGSGTNGVPLGLLNQSGLALILTGSTRSANGTLTQGQGGVPMTYVDCNQFESTIASANADLAVMGWMGTPAWRAAMRSTQMFPGANSMPIWASTQSSRDGLDTGPLGYTAGVTTQLPQNLTFTPSGGSAISGLSAVVFGAWSSMIFADWGISELVLDNITQASAGIYNVIENSLHDTNVRHIEQFAASTCVLAH